MNDSDRHSVLGTVLLPFGDTAAASVDMLLTDACRALPPIRFVSPFSAVGTPSPQLETTIRDKAITSRDGLDARKNLGQVLERSGADYLIVDNSGAWRTLAHFGASLYTVIPGETTDLMQTVWHDVAREQRRTINPIAHGLVGRLAEQYDLFTELCLAHFSPDRIILLRSSAPRFYIDADGNAALTNASPRLSAWVDELDRRFAVATGCHVIDDAAFRIPVSDRWTEIAAPTRLGIEASIAAIVQGPPASTANVGWLPGHPGIVADLAAEVIKSGQPIDSAALLDAIGSSRISFDDLVALLALEQRGEAGRACSDAIKAVLAHPACEPLSQTNAMRSRGLQKLQLLLGSSTELPFSEQPAEIRVDVDPARKLVAFDGTIALRSRVDADAVMDSRNLFEDHAAISPRDAWAVLGSWRFHLGRARNGSAAPPRIVGTLSEYRDACTENDWASLLRESRMVLEVIPPARSRVLYGWFSRADRVQSTVHVSDAPIVDLRPLFSTSTRLVTATGGMMDQITAIAEFMHVCGPAGLDVIVNDLVYATAWSPGFHNGFVADAVWTSHRPTRLSEMIPLRMRARLREASLQQPQTLRPVQMLHALQQLGVPNMQLMSVDSGTGARIRDDTSLEMPSRLVADRHEQEVLIRSSGYGLQCWVYPARLHCYTITDRPAIQATFDLERLDALSSERNRMAAEKFYSERTVAVHVRRGDYLAGHPEWHSDTQHYRDALEFVRNHHLLGTADPLNVAVFSDDPEFVRQNLAEYGLDRVDGSLTFVDWNRYFDSPFDALLVSKCAVVIASVGGFAATAALLSRLDNHLVRARPHGAQLVW